MKKKLPVVMFGLLAAAAIDLVGCSDALGGGGEPEA